MTIEAYLTRKLHILRFLTYYLQSKIVYKIGHGILTWGQRMECADGSHPPRRLLDCLFISLFTLTQSTYLPKRTLDNKNKNYSHVTDLLLLLLPPPSLPLSLSLLSAAFMKLFPSRRYSKTWKTWLDKIKGGYFYKLRRSFVKEICLHFLLLFVKNILENVEASSWQMFSQHIFSQWTTSRIKFKVKIVKCTNNVATQCRNKVLWYEVSSHVMWLVKTIEIVVYS